MSTNSLTPHDADDFELPTKQSMFKLGTAMIARLWRIDLEFDHWTVDLPLAERLVNFHNQCQALQLASPLDGKVCLQTETAARWVERDAYAQNPHQWDSDGQVWVSAAVAL